MTTLSSIESVTWDNVREQTTSDPTMRLLHDTNLMGFPEDSRIMPELTRFYHQYKTDLSIVEAVILYQDRIVIPPSLRDQVMETLQAEVRQNNQYAIKVHGSGRVTLRNRQFLRLYVPHTEKPCPRRITDDIPNRPAVHWEVTLIHVPLGRTDTDNLHATRQRRSSPTTDPGNVANAAAHTNAPSRRT